jgi:hypothetical protein
VRLETGAEQRPKQPGRGPGGGNTEQDVVTPRRFARSALAVHPRADALQFASLCSGTASAVSRTCCRLRRKPRTKASRTISPATCTSTPRRLSWLKRRGIFSWLLTAPPAMSIWNCTATTPWLPPTSSSRPPWRSIRSRSTNS